MARTDAARYKIRGDLVLDLNDFRRALQTSQTQADGAGKKIGRALRDGMRTAADSAIALGFTVEGVKKAYDLVFNSVERLRTADGAESAAVKAFDRIRTSVIDLFDATVKGALGSATAQTVLGAVARGADDLAVSAARLGDRLDEFVTRNAEEILAVGSTVIDVFARIGVAVGTVTDTFRLVAGFVQATGGQILRVISSIFDALASYLGGFSDTLFATWGRKIKAASDALRKMGDQALDAGLSLGDEGLQGVLDELTEGLGRAEERSTRIVEQLRDALDQIARGRSPVAGEEEETGGVGADVITAAEQVATGVQGVFEGATEAIAAMFESLATRMSSSTIEGAQRVLGGFASVFHSMTALGGQAEKAFGKSKIAAEIFTRTQLGLVAILATVKGVEQLGDGMAATARNEVGAAALHVLAAAAYFTAAGLAGAQAIGGASTRSASSTGSGFAAPEPTSAAETVEQRVTKIEFNITGNVIDNDEYVRRELIPAMRAAVEEEDVVLVSTHSKTAAAVGGL